MKTCFFTSGNAVFELISKRNEKKLVVSRKQLTFATSIYVVDYPGKFPERASRIRHYPFFI